MFQDYDSYYLDSIYVHRELQGRGAAFAHALFELGPDDEPVALRLHELLPSGKIVKQFLEELILSPEAIERIGYELLVEQHVDFSAMTLTLSEDEALRPLPEDSEETAITTAVRSGSDILFYLTFLYVRQEPWTSTF